MKIFEILVIIILNIFQLYVSDRQRRKENQNSYACFLRKESASELKSKDNLDSGFGIFHSHNYFFKCETFGAILHHFVLPEELLIT